MDLMCAIELKNIVNKIAIFCFRVPRGIIKPESCRVVCVLNFRFSFTPGQPVRWREACEGAKRNETKTSPLTTPAIVVLLVHRNHRAFGPTRPGPARPGIACCNVDSEGMEAGLGASRCSWDGFGVPPRPLVIHEAPLRNWETQRSVTRDSRAIDCLAVTSTNTPIYPFSPSPDSVQSEIEKRHWRLIVYTLLKCEERKEEIRLWNVIVK